MAKIRCDHCGEWKEECSCFTLNTEVEGYGDYCVCPKCFKKHDGDDLEYWTAWVQRKKAKNSVE